MKSIGTLNLEFGMLNLPMSLSTFADYNDISFSSVCPEGHDIKTKTYCPTCNREIQYSEMKKALKISKDKKIVFDAGIIEAIRDNQDKSCRVLKVFEQKNTYKLKYLIDKTYYLIPKEKFERGYFILREALKDSKKSLLINYIMRTRKRLGLIEPFGDFLILFQLIYGEQVRKPTPLNPIAVSEKDVENAEILLESIQKDTQNVVLGEIKDTYKQELFEAILGKKKVTVKPKQELEDSFSKGLEQIAKLHKSRKVGQGY